MLEFQNTSRLFSSISQETENKQLDSRATDNSAAADDKAKGKDRLHSSYLSSQVCGSQNLFRLKHKQGEPSLKQPLATRDQNRPYQFKSKFELGKLSVSNSYKESIMQATLNDSSIASNGLIKRSTLRSKNLKQSSQNAQNLNKNLNKFEVESVIFDSKATKMEEIDSNPLEYILNTYGDPTQHYLNVFKEKINDINEQIDAGMNNLSKKIKQLRVLNLERKIKEKENLCKMKIEEQANELKQFESVDAHSSQSIQIQNQARLQIEREASPSASKIELAGDFHIQQTSLSQQYTMFINRIAHQIQLDIEFTHQASQLSRTNSLSNIKSYIFNQLINPQSSINESFFEIDPAEMDPLQKKPSSIIQMNHQELHDSAAKLLAKYQELEGHFRTKLKKMFSPLVVALLFEELSPKGGQKRRQSVTVGDLLSYLNMRTGNSFRNRFFVKMMKRLNLKPNGSLTPATLQIFTTHPLVA